MARKPHPGTVVYAHYYSGNINWVPQPTSVNPGAEWQPAPMKVRGKRVWTRHRPGQPNVHRVGRYGTQEFISWNPDGRPNYL